MDEEQWLTCTDAYKMVSWSRDRSWRKRYCFTSGCWGLVKDQLTSTSSQDALAIVERAAETLPAGNPDSVIEEVCEIGRLECEARHDGPWTKENIEFWLAMVAATGVYELIVPDDETAEEWYRVLKGVEGTGVEAVCSWRQFSSTMCDVARCVFGNPFRPLTLQPSLLTDTVVKLAVAIYEERAFDRMAVLADALEESGVTDSALLGHLRGPGPHARGCFALDLILGKE